MARLIGKRGATIVNPDNFMVYTPLLPEAAAGTLEPRHVVVPLRQMCRHAELLVGAAVAHDVERRLVTADTLAGTFEIEYDRLIVALGAIPRRFPVPGLAEHGMGFKDIVDAITLRNHLLRQSRDGSRAARRGRGGAGSRLRLRRRRATPGSRRSPSFTISRRRRSGGTTRCCATFVSAGSSSTQRRRSSRTSRRKLGRYTATELARRGVEIRVSTTLTSFDDDGAVLSTGETVPARTLVWAAGVKAHPGACVVRASARRPRPRRRRPDATGRGFGSTCGRSGDCAAVPNTSTPGQFDPPTCQHALRQARRLASNLEGDPKPYGYRMLGQVATLGRYKGIAELPGLRLRGFPGWFVARSYHLYALPTLRRKARVVTDWTISLFFRRDIVELPR